MGEIRTTSLGHSIRLCEFPIGDGRVQLMGEIRTNKREAGFRMCRSFMGEGDRDFR